MAAATQIQSNPTTGSSAPAGNPVDSGVVLESNSKTYASLGDQSYFMTVYDAFQKQGKAMLKLSQDSMEKLEIIQSQVKNLQAKQKDETAKLTADQGEEKKGIKKGWMVAIIAVAVVATGGLGAAAVGSVSAGYLAAATAAKVVAGAVAVTAYTTTTTIKNSETAKRRWNATWDKDREGGDPSFYLSLTDKEKEEMNDQIQDLIQQTERLSTEQEKITTMDAPKMSNMRDASSAGVLNALSGFTSWFK